jgi:ABC-type antimicrobial peptide transport system ATPase subunit
MSDPLVRVIDYHDGTVRNSCVERVDDYSYSSPERGTWRISGNNGSGCRSLKFVADVLLL